MPVYEYRCRSCGQISDFMTRSFGDSRDPECPKCGSHDMERLLSAPAILKEQAGHHGATCCGRTERCETPPCSTGGSCRRELTSQ